MQRHTDRASVSLIAPAVSVADAPIAGVTGASPPFPVEFGARERRTAHGAADGEK